MRGNSRKRRKGHKEDAARELDKAADALEAASRHFNALAKSNAALHLAQDVRPTPLAVLVEGAAYEARRAAFRVRCKKGPEEYIIGPDSHLGKDN